MLPERFRAITGKYSRLRIAVFGDFCLDRYLEIDPCKQEVSIETGLPVHNVVRVRAQAGGAGTIVNNLAALGIGTIHPIGFVGPDGEGFELCQALAALPGVRPEGVLRTGQRRTFTYCKPLVIRPGQPPVELNRLDSKNWSDTPEGVEAELAGRLSSLAREVDAIIILDQVEVANTGVVTRKTLRTLGEISASRPELFVLADSRRGLGEFPRVVYKMNAAELSRLMGGTVGSSPDSIERAARELAARNGRSVFVTMAEQGILGADPSGEVGRLPCLPVRGPIDVVGAGDAVSANLTSAVAAGASLPEALELANGAASVVVHKLGTTGTASVSELGTLLLP
jgi:rfaE bifunctional protein kinase chain/domain